MKNKMLGLEVTLETLSATASFNRLFLSGNIVLEVTCVLGAEGRTGEDKSLISFWSL